MRYLFLLLSTAISAIAQTAQPVPLKSLVFDGLTSTTIIDNRPAATRQVTYASIACSGSGSWQVDLQYGSTSTGSWTSMGSNASVTQATTPPIAYGFLYTPPNFIRVYFVSGTPTCSFSGTTKLYVSTGAGSVAFPIAISQGGTGATTAANARTNLGISLPLGLSDGGTGGTSAATARSSLGLSLPIAVNSGGTGATDAATARTNLGISLPLSLSNGGTAGTTAATARSNLGLNLTGIYTGDGTTPSAVAASAQLQVMRRKANVAATQYEFSQQDRILASDFNWTSTSGITATGTLTSPGANTITLAPCPLGVSGVDNYTTGWGDINSSNNLYPSSLVVASNTGTLTFAHAHGMDTGQKLTIAGGSSLSALNGTYSVTVASRTELTFTTSGIANGTYTTATTSNYDGKLFSTPNHYIRITDTGTPANTENVFITGGTCTPGASSGTITVTTVNAHTTWNVGSASSGIQEAIKYAEAYLDHGNYPLNTSAPGANGAAVTLAFGNNWVYAPITLKGSVSVAIFGQGTWNSQVYVPRLIFTSGDIFRCVASSQLIAFYNMRISTDGNHTSGAGIHLMANSSGYPIISNVMIDSTYIGLWLDGSGGDTVVNYTYFQNQDTNPSAYAGIRINGAGSGDIVITDGRILTAETTPPANKWLDYGIIVEYADGITISDFVVRGEIGIGVYSLNGSQVGSVFLMNNIIDRCRTHNIEIATVGSPALFNNIMVTGSHILSAPTMDYDDLIVVNTASYSGSNVGVTFNNNVIGNANKNAIKAYNVHGLQITNNRILNANKYVAHRWTAADSPATITSIVDAASVSTITFVPDHGLLTGDLIRIYGMTSSGTANLIGVFSVTKISDKVVTIPTSGVTDGTYTPISDPGMGIVSIGTGSAIDINDSDSVMISGNTLEDTVSPPTTLYGIKFAGVMSNVAITGNIIRNMLFSPILNQASAISSTVSTGNVGLDDVVTAIADSGGVLTLPTSFPKVVAVAVGSGTINTIQSPWSDGLQVTLLCAAGITFSSSGADQGIKTTFGPTTANQTVLATYRASDKKWYLK